MQYEYRACVVGGAKPRPSIVYGNVRVDDTCLLRAVLGAPTADKEVLFQRALLCWRELASAPLAFMVG